jgi:hypothetical protein
MKRLERSFFGSYLFIGLLILSFVIGGIFFGFKEKFTHQGAITHFEEIPWGASSKVIRERFGMFKIAKNNRNVQVHQKMTDNKHLKELIYQEALLDRVWVE